MRGKFYGKYTGEETPAKVLEKQTEGSLKGSLKGSFKGSLKGSFREVSNEVSNGLPREGLKENTLRKGFTNEKIMAINSMVITSAIQFIRAIIAVVNTITS